MNKRLANFVRKPLKIDIISAHFYFLQSGLFKFFEKFGRFLKIVRTNFWVFAQISGLFAHF